MATYAASVGSGTPVVLDDVSATWGRQKLLDHHDSQQARFSVIDPTGAWAPRDLIGQPVTLGWRDYVGGTARTFFRGRLTEHAMTPRKPYRSTFRVGRWRGAVHEFTATGQLTELGQRTTGVESWPDESGAARMDRLRAVAGSTVGNIGFRPYWNGAPIAARNVDNVDVLSLLRAMYDTAGADRMAYDPHTNTVSYQQRRAVISPRRAGLGVKASSGDPLVNVYALAVAGESGVALDGAGFDVGDGALRKAIENRLTRVDYSWTSAGSSLRGVVLDAATEAALGRRGVTLSTELRQGDWAAIVAGDWYQLITREGTAFQPPPMTYRGDLLDGFQSVAHALLLAGGAEKLPGEEGRIVTVTNQPWSRLSVPPLFGIIGGTIRYVDGAWLPTVYLQPCDYQQLVAGDLTGARMKLTGGGEFAWSQLSRSLTWNDLRYAGANT
jgi:hypothetical protein